MDGDQGAPTEFKSGAFNEKDSIRLLLEKKQFKISLDVLGCDYQPFRYSKNQWVVALTLFHYTDKGQRYGWNADHALMLTLADLFCDNVPNSLRSKSEEAEQSLSVSAENYIRSMNVHQHRWSQVTTRTYEIRRELNWPSVNNPKVDVNGLTVEFADLMEVWSFCFCLPSQEVLAEIHSGLWALVIGFTTHGNISSKSLFEAVNDLSDVLDCSLEISRPQVKLIGQHLSPLMTDECARNLFDNLTQSCSEDVQERAKEIIRSLEWKL